MKTLIIDTTSPRLYCILLDGDKVIGNQTQNGLQHSAKLNASIDTLLSQNALALSDIDCFAVNIGTGSFTGIRIAIATVKGFLSVLPDKHIITFTTLQSIAYTDGECDRIMEAGRDLYYHARYDKLHCLIAEQLIDKAEMVRIAQDAKTVKWSADTDYTSNICALVRDKVGQCQFSTTISPIYLRQPQAVEELLAKGNK